MLRALILLFLLGGSLWNAPLAQETSKETVKDPSPKTTSEKTKEKSDFDKLGKWFQGPKIDPKKLPLKIDTGALDLKEGEGEERIWIATEGVHLWQEHEGIIVLDLRCEQAVIWFTAQDGKEGNPNSPEANQQVKFYGEGNVHFRWGKELMQGDQVFFDMEKNSGVVHNGTMRSKVQFDNRITPLQLKAQEILIHSRNKFTANNAKFSTCQFGDPHYHFASDYLEIVKVENKAYLKARENSLHVGETPFFYLPYFSGETIENFPLKSISYGNSSRFGNHLLTTWGGNVYKAPSDSPNNIIKKVDWILDLDIYQDRGLGLGPGFTYQGETGSEYPFIGQLSSYYIRDQALEDFGDDLEGNNNQEIGDATLKELYRIYYLHRHELPDGWKLDIEISKISDEELLFDFFEKEAREGKEQESYAHLKKIWGIQGVTFLARYNFNDFIDQVNELPRGTYHLVRMPIFQDYLPNLFFSSDIELTNISRDDNVIISEFDRERIFRADFKNRLTYRFQLGPVNFVPFLDARMTYFEKEADGDRNIARFVGSGGIEAAVNFHRVFHTTNKFFDLYKLQHIFTPRISYSFTETTINSDSLIPFDEVDTIDDANQVRLRLINRLKTIRAGQLVDILFAEFDLSYFPDQGGSFDDKLSNLEFDLSWQIWRNLSFGLNTEFNFPIHDFEVLSAGLSYTLQPDLITSVDFRYLRGDSFIGTLAADYRINAKWQAGFRTQYDFRDGELRENEITFRRVFHRFALDLIFEVDEVDDEVAFTISFTPLDFVQRSRFVDTDPTAENAASSFSSY